MDRVILLNSVRFDLFDTPYAPQKALLLSHIRSSDRTMHQPTQGAPDPTPIRMNARWWKLTKVPFNQGSDDSQGFKGSLGFAEASSRL